MKYNITNSQTKQIELHRKHQSTIKKASAIKVGDKVLLKNRRKEQRKGDKLSPRYLGPYTIRSISARGQVCIVVQILLIGMAT